MARARANVRANGDIMLGVGMHLTFTLGVCVGVWVCGGMVVWAGAMARGDGCCE